MKAVIFKYINYKGELTIRSLIPETIEFNASPGFNYQPGWFITGLDTDKNQRRSFALSHIIFPEGTKSFYIKLEND